MTSPATDEQYSIFRNFVESSQDLFWQCDSEGRYTYLNPAWKKILGYPADEMLGKKITEFFKHPDSQYDRDFFSLMTGGNTVRGYETVQRNRSGEDVHIVFNAEPLRNDVGSFVGMSGIAYEITDRKKTEVALRESESRYRSLIENLPQKIFQKGTDSRYVYCNRNYAEDLGILPEEIFGRNDFDFYPEELAKKYREDDRRVMQLGRIEDIDEQYMKNGRRFTIHTVKIPLTDSKGGVNGILGIFWDITEQKAAEMALREKESLLANLGTQIPGMIYQFVKSPDGKYTVPFCSTGVKSIFGCSPDDIRYSFEPIYNAVHPDDRELLVNSIEESAATMTQWKCEYRVKLPGEQVKWLYGNSLPEKTADGSIVWCGYNTDITDRKLADISLRESEQRYRELFDNAGQGIVITRDGMIQFANPYTTHVTGFSKEEILSKPFSTFVHPADRAFVIEQYQKRLEGKKIPPYVFRLQKTDGSIIWLEVSAVLIEWEGKIATLNFMNDITERKKAEDALSTMQKLESLGVLAGGIAHDFNNLLGGIFGYIDLARETSGDEMNSAYLSKALDTIDRARDLTRQLLTFAKGGAPVTKNGPLFPFIKDTAQFALSGSSVACEFNIPANLRHCNYDANQIGQVIDNIIINAQQAMPLGGVIHVTARNETITAKEHPVLPAGEYIRISITDSGIGIPEEYLPRLFDPFFTTKKQGHGLGLATSFSIVKRHGGIIEVESAPGKGSTFHLLLPASDSNALPEETSRTVRHHGHGTVIVMDDEPVMRESIAEMVRQFGYTVICADDGKEALEDLQKALDSKHTVVCMILDLTVPGGMGGKEAIEKIREQHLNLPVFVSSGYAEDQIMSTPERFGFTASICKPFRIAELAAMFENNLNRRN